jgi:hypothetical protein
MKIKQIINRTRAIPGIAMLCTALIAALPASAKDHKPKAQAAIKVVANLQFDEKSAADMLIRQSAGKSYLYVQLANREGVVVIDITNPARLAVVSSMTADQASELSFNGNLAVMTAVATTPASEAAGKGELVLWDISDPGNPRIVKRFAGVRRVLQDERNYTYILNQDGLWVISDKQNNSDDSWNPSIYGG